MILVPSAITLDSFQCILVSGIDSQGAIEAFQLGLVGRSATRHPKPSQNIVWFPFEDPFEARFTSLKIAALYCIDGTV